MLDMSGKTGKPGDISRLPPEVLKSFNIHGEGYFRNSQDGASYEWVLSDCPNPENITQEEYLRDLATSINDGQTLEEDGATSWHEPWASQADSGDKAERSAGPVQFVLNLMDFWRLDKRDVIRLLGYDPEDIEHVSAILGGRKPLGGRDARDRVVHLFHMRRTLWSLFRDPDVENDWLREGHSLLDGNSPLSLMLEGSMENLLLTREYIESAAGIR